MTWPYARVVAHRGGGTLAPENTLAAVEEGYRRGFRAVEFDVMLARDGVPVVIHDPYLGRTVAGSGNVSDYDGAELRAMDAGSWFSAAYAGEPVPAFVDYAHYCKAHGIWMNIEIKPVPGVEAETGAVVARIAAVLFAGDLGTPAAPLLSSFSMAALAAAKTAAPALQRACLFDRLPTDWQAHAVALDAVAIHTNHQHLTAQATHAIKSAGFGLLCYTVNSLARARTLRAWGVDCLCTDRLDLIGPTLA
ncbi:MAG: glycerophosphodiester phosphodiesterase [Pseudomonadota bacterium]|nr:glycerophosphodiester phosphodiesterase [Pseudomonadota bacterium]